MNLFKTSKGRSFPRLSLKNNLEKIELERKKKTSSIKYLGEIRERFVPDTNEVNDLDREI